MPNTNQNQIQSVQNLFEILDAIQENKEASVSRIAENVNLTKGSVYKYLETLRQDGYLVRENGQYQLTFKILRYGGRVRENNDLCAVARPYVYELAEETGEKANFIIENNGYAYLVYAVNDQYGFMDQIKIGERAPLHEWGAGRAILSQFSDGEIRSLYESHQSDGNAQEHFSDLEELFEEIEKVRDQGYSIRNDLYDGVRGIGAPVRHEETGEIGAFSITTPMQQTDREPQSDYIDAVVEISNRVEVKARYSNG